MAKIKGESVASQGAMTAGQADPNSSPVKGEESGTAGEQSSADATTEAPKPETQEQVVGAADVGAMSSLNLDAPADSAAAGAADPVDEPEEDWPAEDDLDDELQIDEAVMRLTSDGITVEGKFDFYTGEGVQEIRENLERRLAARGTPHIFPATPSSNPRCTGCDAPKWQTKPGETCPNPKVDDGQTDEPGAEGAA